MRLIHICGIMDTISHALKYPYVFSLKLPKELICCGKYQYIFFHIRQNLPSSLFLRAFLSCLFKNIKPIQTVSPFIWVLYISFYSLDFSENLEIFLFSDLFFCTYSLFRALLRYFAHLYLRFCEYPWISLRKGWFPPVKIL